jgi:tripartite-type tricarboxylate transporter receptor subunit TctC
MKGMTMNRRRLMLAGAAGLALAHGPASAQPAFPSKPIRLVVPYAPGGGADLVARALARSMAQTLGQPIVVDNRAGANGNIGLDVVAKSAADGYTLLMGTAATQSINPALYPRLPFDVTRDFTPLGLVATGPHLLVFSPTRFSAVGYADFMAQAKGAAKLAFASSGSGSTAHLTAELWRDQVGVAAVHVAYRGTGPALLDVISGQVDFMFCPIAAALPFVQGGKLTAVLVTSAARLPSLPTVPTGVELGMPNLLAELWYALYGPAKLPHAVVSVLGSALSRAVSDAEVRQVFAAQALIALPPDPQALAAQQRADLLRWTKVVKATGAMAE